MEPPSHVRAAVERARQLPGSGATILPKIAAHPYGIKSANRIRRKMAGDTDERGTRITKEEYIRRFVFIKEIELYRRL